MGSTDRAACHQFLETRRNVNLAAMAAQRGNARVERRVRAARGVGRERARRERRYKKPLGLEKPHERMGRGKLRTVEQRKPLLGGERNRREARAIESGVRRQGFGGEARV